MKAIHAYLKEHKLAPVVMALRKLEQVSGLTYYPVSGYGRGRAADSPNRFLSDGIAYVRHLKLEIVVPDALAAQVVELIQQHAHTGLRGDGKIYVLPVEDAVRISTGEHGQAGL